MKPQILLALALAATSASAATINWTNTLGGDWFLAQNWNPNIVPGAGDTANITQPGTYDVSISTGAVAVVRPSALCAAHFFRSFSDQDFVVHQCCGKRNWT